MFLLLIAVRWHHAGPFSKALIAGGGSLGLLLSPWLVSKVESSRVLVAQAAARLCALTAASFALMALVPALPVYVFGCVVAVTATNATIPLLTQIYQENYPSDQRGRLFARTMMIRIATAALISELAGRVLSHHIDRFRWLLVLFAGAGALGWFCLSRCPSTALTVSGGTHPFRAFRFVRQDRVFRQTLISWVFMGFAMLMMAPLRVEYLANPRYGVQLKGQALTAGAIALLTGVIPNLARLVLNPVWGWLFDRMNFFALRLTLNAAFAISILAFFTTGSFAGLVVGAVVLGIANSGADLAWSLWVTKFAPPDRVADYMSVHTFFAGVRGVFAPLVAFYLVSGLAPATLGWISVLLIATGSAFLVPELKFGRRPATSARMPTEVPD